ncbi:MAG TPA: T9SS type A sorting domain-containing protein [Arachidicoccus sp.]|nr:T9SS type A sorting domain-containing protein [Arachidicoccus sp.]
MKKMILFSVCLFLTAGIYAQQIVYVSASATGTGSGTSWTDAFTDFQAGVNAAVSGDTVFVAGGIYQPASGQSFFMKDGVKIYGGFAGTEGSLGQRNLAAGDTSILKGSGYSVIRNDNALNTTAVLDGFKITGGTANQGYPGNCGGGIYNGNSSSPLLTNLIITENTATYVGGAMYNLNGSSPVLFNVIFTKNSAVNGGAIYNMTGCSPRVINTTFWKNVAPSGGAAMYNYSANAPVLINVIMWGNELSGGGDGPSASIYNAFAGAQPVVSHSLIAHCFGSGASWAYYVGTDGGSNIDTDPKFIDPVNGNFGLKINSRAINAGDNAAIPTGYSSDLAGDGRIFNQATGGLVDIGAYEYQGNPLRPDAGGTLYVNSTAATGGDGSSWAKALQSFDFALHGGTIVNAQAVTVPVDSLRQIWVAKGTYQPDTAGHSFFMMPKVKIYGGFAGTEPSLAMRNLNANDTCFLKGNGSSVIQNMNSGLDSTSLLDGFCITGGHPSGMTTTDGSGGGILNQSVSPVLSHLIIKDNSASMGGGMFNIAGAAPHLTDVIITGNTAQTGGGIENFTASPVLRNVSITANTAQMEGGGMYNGNSASPVLTNVLISDNKVTAGFGGAMTNYNLASPLLTNVTMTANTASSRGGAMHNYIQSSPILTNCILWGNSAVNGQEIWNSSAATVSFHYCLYAGGPDDIVENAGSSTVADAHSITIDPQFADASNHNYQLSAGSPAINAGVSDSITADNTTDVAGKPRIFNKVAGGVVDMGAYEYQGPLHPGANGVLYVDSAAAPGGDGSSWATAVTQLSDALKTAAELNLAAPGTAKEIWVTSGTYYPSYTPVTELDNGDPVSVRDRTFMLVQDVPIYGGFNGTETSAGERSPVTGKGTVLSGDIGVPGDLSDNAYHVVTAIGDGTKDIFTGLGNLTIAGGNANGASSYSLNGHTALQRQGGGVYLGKANLAFANCLFAGNRALKKGGAIMNVSGALSISNSTYVINCTFADNDAEAGKAIYNYQTPTPILIVNSIVLGSVAYEGPSPVVNFSLVEGLPADPANGDLDGSIDPQFVDASGGNYRLTAGSPAVNAGGNFVINMTDNPVDLDGNPRITDYITGGIVDMGPYEYYNPVLPVKMSPLSGAVSNTGHAMLSWKSFSEINNKGFLVQSSIDGNHFENGSLVPSKVPGGNSTTPFDYTFDAGLLTGVRYYRLVQTDINGKITYSNVIHLAANNAGFTIKAYPNPAHNIVHIHIDGEQFANGQLMIVAATGSIVRVQKITGADTKIDLSGLNAGIYMLKYTDGRHTSTLKIIKD